jgi:hypothetical protein
MFYARQLNQRRMSAFYLLPQPNNDGRQPARGQLSLENVSSTEDRPRTLREMFADIEYDNEEDTL